MKDFPNAKLPDFRDIPITVTSVCNESYDLLEKEKRVCELS